MVLATDAESVIDRFAADPALVVSVSVSFGPSADTAVMEKGRSVPPATPAASRAVTFNVTLPPGAILPGVQVTAGGAEMPSLEAP